MLKTEAYLATLVVFIIALSPGAFEFINTDFRPVCCRLDVLSRFNGLGLSSCRFARLATRLPLQSRHIRPNQEHVPDFSARSIISGPIPAQSPLRFLPAYR